MSINYLIQQVLPFFHLIRDTFDCMNGFLVPILGIFSISLTMGIAFYILHRL